MVYYFHLKKNVFSSLTIIFQLQRQFSSLSADENSNNAKIGMEIKGVKKDHPVAHHLGSSSQQSTVFLDRLTATFERYQQLQNRFVEIQHELGDTNIELQLLLREYQQQTGESEIERLQKQLVQLQNERQLVAVQQMNALTSPHPPNSSTAASILQNSQLTQVFINFNTIKHQNIILKNAYNLTFGIQIRPVLTYW